MELKKLKKLHLKKKPDFIFIDRVYNLLTREFGEFVNSPLQFQKDYEFVIAVILSAQCTDERVNQVTPALFQEFSSLESFIHADPKKIESLIFPTGFYKNKTKSILGFTNKLFFEYKGILPNSMELLLEFPGVGRKTANVILNELFSKSEGIVVDTHVKRISKLLGFTESENPIQIEKDLMNLLPKKYWSQISLLLIFLGRKWCKAKNRMCKVCILNQICPSKIGN